MRVIAIPCLKDNYAYLLVDARRKGVVVDPSEAAPVEAVLRREGVELAGIWLTHHHLDHVGGVEGLCADRGALPVLGSAYDRERGRIPRQTRGLREGETLEWDGHDVRVSEIPGHTLGAIAFDVAGCLFSGDTLFIAGCGRVFEGTMSMMQQSLQKLRELPPDTRVYCGHEYTIANLRFAQAVEPDAQAIAERAAWAAEMRARGEPTTGAPLRDDLATNPFLRWDAPAVIARAREWGSAHDDPASVFAALRSAKDRF
jgi:hydroxyacylglutathione hydrolase